MDSLFSEKMLEWLTVFAYIGFASFIAWRVFISK
jgi:hypothetical protein